MARPVLSREAGPEKLARLDAGQFPTTEINASFYRPPTIEAVQVWRQATPRGFIFAWKAYKFITHWKRLNETSANSIALMETRLKVLGPKLVRFCFSCRHVSKPIAIACGAL